MRNFSVFVRLQTSDELCKSMCFDSFRLIFHCLYFYHNVTVSIFPDPSCVWYFGLSNVGLSWGLSPCKYIILMPYDLSFYELSTSDPRFKHMAFHFVHLNATCSMGGSEKDKSGSLQSLVLDVTYMRGETCITRPRFDIQ